MKYNFHAGDYVEVRNGRVGFLAYMVDGKNSPLIEDDEIEYGIAWKDEDWPDPKNLICKKKDIFDIFKRIGKYDVDVPVETQANYDKPGYFNEITIEI